MSGKLLKKGFIDPKLLKPHKLNVKVHPKAQIERICESIKLVGFEDPVFIDNSLTIWGGHAATEAAIAMKIKKIPYVNISHLPDEKKKLFMILDNQANESEWNLQNTKIIIDELTPLLNVEDYHIVVENIIPKINFDVEPNPTVDKERDIKEVTIPDEAPARAQPGDIFQLGPHRVMCGDCTDLESRTKLFGDAKPETVCTDPPYSSGGRQEAHKKNGSIGSKRIAESGQEVSPKIKMDDLSTCAYIHLIKGSLYGLDSDILYMFTDWRMWDWTREASEAAAFPVRNMIVWDKQTPGMGIQWRGQHELVCFAKRTALGGPYHKGNVISIKRSGNEHHPTEKPIALLVELLENTNGNIVYDPFGGSGSTMIACQQLNKVCYTMELDECFVDIILKRWEDFTQEKAVKIE